MYGDTSVSVEKENAHLASAVQQIGSELEVGQGGIRDLPTRDLSGSPARPPQAG